MGCDREFVTGDMEKPGCGVCRAEGGHTAAKALPAKWSPLIRSPWGPDSDKGAPRGICRLCSSCANVSDLVDGKEILSEREASRVM